MKFSQRIGKTPIKEILQIESIDDELRNRIWNNIIQNFFDKLETDKQGYGRDSPKMAVSEYLWKEFFKNPVDRFPTSAIGNRSLTSFLHFVREWFYKAEWYEIYDFLELLCDLDSKANLRLSFSTKINKALSKELAGYRIIEDKVTQITKEEEVAAIEDALTSTDKWKSVNSHLSAAIASLSQRNNPQYRNSIKESISAVEALCKIITGDDKATLGKALSEIENTHKIHRALKSAFSAIYGYTSDSSGIRHALLENDNDVDLDEAKFMLISCSAFINYLIAKSSK